MEGGKEAGGAYREEVVHGGERRGEGGKRAASGEESGGRGEEEGVAIAPQRMLKAGERGGVGRG